MSNWKKEFVTDHRHRANSLTYKECLKVKTNNPVGKKCVYIYIYIYTHTHSFCASHKNEKMLNLAHKKKKKQVKTTLKVHKIRTTCQIRKKSRS